jgi:hypothetical protein
MSDSTPIPDRETELTDAALDWLNSDFARKVALMLTPVLLPVLGALAFWLEDSIGIDMDPAEATGFVVAVVLGAAAVIYAFVVNHGKGAAQLGQSALELASLYEAGRSELAKDEAAGTAIGDEGSTYYYGPGSELGERPDTAPEEAGAKPDEPPPLEPA